MHLSKCDMEAILKRPKRKKVQKCKWMFKGGKSKDGSKQIVDEPKASSVSRGFQWIRQEGYGEIHCGRVRIKLLSNIDYCVR